MTRQIPIIVGVLLVLVLIAFNTTYTVAFNEIAIKTRFGRTERVVQEPGLHFKAPFFIERVTKLDRRLQLVDSALETVATRDGQQVLVQGYLLWRVDGEDDGVRRFFETYSTIDEAARSIETMLQAALRVLTGNVDFNELVGPNNRLAEAEARVMAELARTLPVGVRPESVGLSQIVLPSRTSIAVVRRMQATQERLAETERIRGNAEAEAIRSEAATKADKLRGFADQLASSIESEGTRAAQRHWEQLRTNEDLAIFLAWLDAFKRSMTGNVTIFMDTRQAPMHLLDFAAPVGASGVPQPQIQLTPPAQRGASARPPSLAPLASRAPAERATEDDRVADADVAAPGAAPGTASGVARPTATEELQ